MRHTEVSSEFPIGEAWEAEIISEFLNDRVAALDGMNQFNDRLKLEGPARREQAERTMRLSKKGIMLIVISALLPIVCLSGCTQKKATQPPAPKVTVVKPIGQVVMEYLELTGNTQASDSIQLVARVSGYLEKIFFRDGQNIKKGMPLFLIQQNTYEAALRQAEAQIVLYQAQMDYAGAQFLRYSDLLARNAASKSDVDNWRYQKNSAEANLKAAIAQRDLAKLNLDYTIVTAPFDGRIDRKLQDVGSYVGASGNTLLALCNRIDPIYVYFTIGDLDLARLRRTAHYMPGQSNTVTWPIMVGLAGEEGYPHRGAIDFSSINLSSTTGTLLMRGTLPNASGKILPGLYARVQFPIEKRAAFVIPASTVGEDQQGPFVMTVNTQNTVERRNIKTGPMTGIDRRAVYEGLNGNERVVVRGIRRAIAGKMVMPEWEGPDAGKPLPQATALPKQ